MLPRISNIYIKLKNIFNNNPTFWLSFIVGIISGISAVLLKNFVHFLSFWVTTKLAFYTNNTLYFIFPLIGIILTSAYIKVFHKNVYQKGLSTLIKNIAQHKPDIDFHYTYSHIVTSGLTVGFGGSVGLEAPIVSTGSAIGSNIARYFRLNKDSKILLMGCGISAGIAAIFNSPIAGVLFVLEVIIVDFSLPNFIPLLLSSATATVISRFAKSERLFLFASQGWEFKAIPHYFILGILLGFLSFYVIRTNQYFGNFDKNLTKFRYKAVTYSCILGFLIFLFPPLYGEGYITIQNMLNNNISYFYSFIPHKNYLNINVFIILFTIILSLIKIIASNLTIRAGGNGGIFAPSLYVGAVFGFFYSFTANFFGVATLRTGNFTAVAMAGVLAGVVHCPLTAIFLIAEITGGYELFVPLMIVVSTSYFISRSLSQHSIYTISLAEEGFYKLTAKETSLVNKILLDSVIEKDFAIVTQTSTMKELVEIIKTSKRNIFAVTDKSGNFKGLIYLDDIREHIFNYEIYDIMLCYELAVNAPEIIQISDDMVTIMNKFERSKAWNLPVVDNNIFIGFISKSSIFNEYRKNLI